MTVIAYRDGVMAADTATLWPDDGIVAHGTEKLFRSLNGILFGVAGDDVPDLTQAVDHYVMDFSIPYPGDFDFGLLIASPFLDHLLMWEDRAACHIIREPYYAIGSGSAVAMGAMSQGATSTQAVAAAIKHGANCGGETLIIQWD